MASLLVLGATGYIGNAVAVAARRAGFTVYAQTRSQGKATSLAAAELIPVVCDPTDADALKATIEKCEFIAECGGDMETPRANTDAVIKAIRACKGPMKRHILYTSGILVHGSHPGETLSEDQIKPGVISWRYEIENYILGLEDIDATVLRPAFCYGGTGGAVFALFFVKPETGKLQIPGPDKIWSWVHIDDLGEAFVLAMKRRSIAAGRAYDIGEPYGPRYEDLRVACAKLAGYDGEVEYPKPEGMEAFFDAGGTVVVSGKRALDELGWTSNHTGVMAQLPLYYESFKASRK